MYLLSLVCLFRSPGSAGWQLLLWPITQDGMLGLGVWTLPTGVRVPSGWVETSPSREPVTYCRWHCQTPDLLTPWHCPICDL